MEAKKKVKCVCGFCKSCRDHRRYLCKREEFGLRNRLRILRRQERCREIRESMDSFVRGDLDLRGFEECLDG